MAERLQQGVHNYLEEVATLNHNLGLHFGIFQEEVSNYQPLFLRLNHHTSLIGNTLKNRDSLSLIHQNSKFGLNYDYEHSRKSRYWSPRGSSKPIGYNRYMTFRVI